MARCLDAVEGAVTPDRRIILIVGKGCDRGDFVPDFSQRRLCYAARDVMYLMSAAQWHDAGVVLEAWDGPPPIDPDAEFSEETELELSQGGAFVSALTAPAVTPVLAIGPPGRYAVRVDVRGRAELLRRLADVTDRPHGVEQFWVRFWTAADSGHDSR